MRTASAASTGADDAPPGAPPPDLRRDVDSAAASRRELPAPPDPSAAPTADGPPAAMPVLDVLRIVSVCAIVWFHAQGPGTALFGFRLPAIALITSLVQSRSTRWRPMPVLLPWIFWYAVYLAVLAYRVAVHGAAVASAHQWYNPAAGPEWHLWYGPFALFAGLAAHRFRDATRPQLVAATLAGFGVSWLTADLGFPASQWGLVLPAIPAGMLLGRAPRLLDVALLATGGGLLVGQRYATAILLVWAASRVKGTRFKQLANLTRGAYWSHMLVIAVLLKAGIASPVAMVAATLAFAAVLAQIPQLRKII